MNNNGLVSLAAFGLLAYLALRVYKKEKVKSVRGQLKDAIKEVGCKVSVIDSIPDKVLDGGCPGLRKSIIEAVGDIDKEKLRKLLSN